MARVVRHESERDRWEMVHGAPDPRLDGYVLNYCAYDERTGSFTRRRELPSERVVIILNLGEPIRVMSPDGSWSTHGEGFFAGMHDTFAVTETSGAQRGVQIDLSPVGAHLLLREPMHELTSRLVTLEELFGGRGVLLREAVASAPRWEAKFALLDQFFLARLDDALSPGPDRHPRARPAAGERRGECASRRSPPSSAVAGAIWWRASASRSACPRSCSGGSCASTMRSG